jgi:hypothetical protein
VAAVVGAIYAATISMEWLFIALPLAALVLVGCGASYLLVRRERAMSSIVAIVCLVAAVVAHGSGPLVAKWNEEESAKAFCVRLNDYLRPGERLTMYGFYEPKYAVYTGRFVGAATDEGLASWFAEEEPVYVLTDEPHIRSSRIPPLAAPRRPARRRRRQGHALISNAAGQRSNRWGGARGSQRRRRPAALPTREPI